MMNLIRKFAFLLLAFAVLGAEGGDWTTDESVVPDLKHRIEDTAGLLRRETIEKLELQLQVFETKTSSQMAVLTIPTLSGGETIEEYSERVFQKWKLGQKDRDNGLLLVIAVQNRKMRLEVGYGLEGVISDAKAKQILARTLVPYFKVKDYDRGISEAVDATLKLAAGENFDGTIDTAAPARPESIVNTSGGVLTQAFGFLGGILFTLFFCVWYVPFAIAAFAAGWVGVGLWLFLCPFVTIFPYVFGGVWVLRFFCFLHFIVFPFVSFYFRKTVRGRALLAGWQKERENRLAVSRPSRSSSGFSSSRSSSYSRWSSFSGGGGRSGGGGASSSW